MPPAAAAASVLGRYALHGEIASGGMATVHYGRLLGEAGFSRTVAIKRLHPQFAKDPEFTAMFLDEARLAARIRHPNVVSTLDVVAAEGELFLVMEYVQGESLSRLVSALQTSGERVPPPVAVAILVGALHGLHAAHEATDEQGAPLHIVHRDVSPQNVLVGVDGVARVLDFGVAKAAGRAHTTRDGQVKGKLGYMSPEQLMGQVSRATDVFAASIVLWEALTGRRLFSADSEGEVVRRIVEARVEPPSRHAPGLPPALDEVTLRGLARDPKKRFATAREMARALESALPASPASQVGDFVERTARAALEQRARQLAIIEAGGALDAMRPSTAAARPAGGEPDTQLSASSRTAERASLPGRGTRLRAALTASAAIGAAGLLLAAGMRLGARQAAAVSAPAPFSTPAALVPGAPPAVSAASAGASLAASPASPAASPAEPSTPDTSAPAPPAPGRAQADFAGPSTAPSPARGGAARPGVRPRPRPSVPSCSPPYTVDADGFRHYKRECAR